MRLATMKIYILEQQFAINNYLIEKNKFVIDKEAKENDINAILLETVLKVSVK